MSKTVQLQEKEGVSYLDTYIEYMEQFSDTEKDKMNLSAGALYKIVKELQEKIVDKTHPFILVKFPFKDLQDTEGLQKYHRASNQILEILGDFGWGCLTIPDEVDQIEFHQFDVQGLEKLDVEDLKKKVDKLLENLV